MTSPSKLQPLVLLEDEPVRSFKDDQLGIEPFARVIAGAAIGTNGPFTIGVFANWGEGKTSLLRQAKSLIDEQESDVVTVWFNAWQYEKEEHPILPLVASIVRAVEQKLATMKKRSGKIATALSDVGRALRAIAYGFSGKAKVAVPGFAEVEAGFVAKEMINRYEKLASIGDPLLDRTLYYNAFEALERIAGEQPSGDDAIKIVVFIDDLDRCLPPQALKLLESIKLVLAQRGFVFALAVDRRVLESFLAVRYKKEYGIADYRTSGTQYLDKIVQLPLSLPPHRARFGEYIKRLLNGPVFRHPSNEQVRAAVEQLGDVLAAGSNYNPRSLVRFLNNLIVDRQIWVSLQQQGTGEVVSQIDAKRLGLCAVSRILRQHLGDSLYRWLAGNNTVCDLVANDRFGKDSPKEKPAAATLHERSLRELEMCLDESPFLGDLLRTESGKSWLTDHDSRRSVDEFLVEPREKVFEVEDGRGALEAKLLTSKASSRYSAMLALAKQWPDERTRELIENCAVKDKSGSVRRLAIQHLAGIWPDAESRKLLEQCVLKDEDEDVRSTAFEALARLRPDVETLRLARQRASFDGCASSVWGGKHSRFCRIVFTKNLDGEGPYLDPTMPIPRDHIEQAAKQVGIPDGKIWEKVARMSEHMGWDITEGSGQ